MLCGNVAISIIKTVAVAICLTLTGASRDFVHAAVEPCWNLSKLQA